MFGPGSCRCLLGYLTALTPRDDDVKKAVFFLLSCVCSCVSCVVSLQLSGSYGLASFSLLCHSFFCHDIRCLVDSTCQETAGIVFLPPLHSLSGICASRLKAAQIHKPPPSWSANGAAGHITAPPQAPDEDVVVEGGGENSFVTGSEKQKQLSWFQVRSSLFLPETAASLQQPQPHKHGPFFK